MADLRHPRALLLLAVLAGCVGGDTGTEGSLAVCGDRGSEMKLGPDDPTRYGTPRELAATAQGEQRTELRYWTPNGQDHPLRHATQASIELTVDLESARLVERKTHGRPESSCPPQLELDAVLRLETSDGAFAERIPGQVGANASFTQKAFFAGELAVRDLNGTYPVGDDPELGPLHVTMHLRTEPRDDAGTGPAWQGQVSLSHSARWDFSQSVAEW